MEYKMPLDMRKGNKFGLLTLTGNFRIDGTQNRVHEAVCECGSHIWAQSQIMRKRKCCNANKHREYRKESTMRDDRLYHFKKEYIGQRIRNCDVVDVTMSRKKYSLILVCCECGKTFKRNINPFINGETSACTRMHEEEKQKRAQQKEITDRQRQKEKERLLKEAIKRNGGVYRYKDITGQKFGKLTVARYAGVHVSKRGSKTTLWVCKCDCGCVCTVKYSSLKRGNKLCDDELAELKIQQGKRTSKMRRDKSIANGTYKIKSFREKNNKKLSQFSKGIYEKYNGVCQKCRTIHDKEKSHAHHMIPIAQNKNTALVKSNGILLCDTCHYNFHMEYGFDNFSPVRIMEFLFQKRN